jgi:hypothetical protein
LCGRGKKKLVVDVNVLGEKHNKEKYTSFVRG